MSTVQLLDELIIHDTKNNQTSSLKKLQNYNELNGLPTINSIEVSGNKTAEEYNLADKDLVYMSGIIDFEDYTMPSITENGTTGESNYAVSISAPALQENEYVLTNTLTNLENSWSSTENPELPITYMFYTKNQLKLESLFFQNIVDETGNVFSIGNYEIQGSIDGNTWQTLGESTNTNNQSGASWITEIVNSTYYHYHQIIIKSLIQQEAMALSSIIPTGVYRVSDNVRVKDVVRHINSNYVAKDEFLELREELNSLKSQISVSTDKGLLYLATLD